MRPDEDLDVHLVYTFLDMYKLDTPESVAVTYPVAGVGSRFLAALIDSLVQTAIVVALFIVTLVVTSVTGSSLSAGTTATYVALAIGTLIISVVLLGYYIFFELIWNGQSPGKRAMRLRVIGINGYPVTPFAVLIRNVLRLIDFLPAYYGVGVIAMIANKDARRLGDFAAGTIVVKEGREGALSSLSADYPYSYPAATGAAAGPAFGAPSPPPGSGSGFGSGYGVSSPAAGPTYSLGYGASSPAAPHGATPPLGQPGQPGQPDLDTYGIDASRLTREDAALIRDFLDRRRTLAYERRNALGYQIAALVHGHVGGETARFTAEAYLEQVLRLASG